MLILEVTLALAAVFTAWLVTCFEPLDVSR
jgi:hypothetical protein